MAYLKDFQDTEIGGYLFHRTCSGYPEQYDVLKCGVLAGYVRLRHGWFSARALPSQEELVEYEFEEHHGFFEDNESRMKYLGEVAEALKLYYATRHV